MKKEYTACSTCRFYPFCRISTGINEIINKNDFVKRGEKTSGQYIADMCKYYETFGVKP